MEWDAVAIGELLVDFTPAGAAANGAPLFAQNPGGAPANVLAANSRLGGKTAFIGKVGRDGFGRFLRQTLESAGVGTQGLCETGAAHTTLAFVHLDAAGDRSFTFYRAPGADILLDERDLPETLLQHTGLLHFGSLSLVDAPCRAATWAAVRTAKEAGALISYDPNYRAPLWPSEQEAVQQMKAGLTQADLVKLSEEELRLLAGAGTLSDGAAAIRRQGAAAVLVTLGKRGVFYQTAACEGLLPTYDVPVKDTNGAGDAFTGAVHYLLRGKNKAVLGALAREEWADILDFANAVGALATTKSGAIPAMPLPAEVARCRETVPHLAPG